jgi:hypothetical protein
MSDSLTFYAAQILKSAQKAFCVGVRSRGGRFLRGAASSRLLTTHPVAPQRCFYLQL